MSLIVTSKFYNFVCGLVCIKSLVFLSIPSQIKQYTFSYLITRKVVPISIVLRLNAKNTSQNSHGHLLLSDNKTHQYFTENLNTKFYK